MQGLLELAVLQRDGRLVGDGLEQAQVVGLEAAALAEPVDDRDRAEDAALADERTDHRLLDLFRLQRSTPRSRSRGTPRVHAGRERGASRRAAPSGESWSPVRPRRRRSSGARLRHSDRGTGGARRAPPGTSCGRGRGAPRSPNRARARSAAGGSTRRAARGVRASRARRCRPDRRGTRSPSAPRAAGPTAGPP